MTKSPDKKRPSIFDDGSAQKRGAIAGRNIYIDDKGQTIMYISRTQTGYILKRKMRRTSISITIVSHLVLQ